MWVCIVYYAMTVLCSRHTKGQDGLPCPQVPLMKDVAYTGCCGKDAECKVSDRSCF